MVSSVSSSPLVDANTPSSMVVKEAGLTTKMDVATDATGAGDNSPSSWSLAPFTTALNTHLGVF